jgi:CheY-like chemotaxis protein
MVHNILRTHGGSVSVDSVVGEGSSFTLLLPTSAGPSESEIPPKPEPEALGASLRVMVVDDELALARAAGRFLGKLGYAVSVYADPREALAAFSAEPSSYDALVLDFQMPELSGLELARAVFELRSGTPIILVSGHLDAKQEEAARSLGIVEVLSKPYGMAELSDAILQAAEG